MTDIVDFIHERHSEAKLIDPAPAGKTLEAILQCAMRAPDHGALKPWRYIMLEGKARESLGRAWAEIVQAETPDVSAQALEKARNALLRAPAVLVAVTRVQNHPKVPALEQHLSTGVGLGYLLLALQARGFGGFWRTGAMAYHPRVHEFLKLGPREAITGFLYIGTPRAPRPALPMPALSDHLSYWKPD